MDLDYKDSHRKVMDSIYRDYCPGDYCVYCGDIAMEIDHAPPISKAEWYSRHHFKQFFRVPACTECNSVLGDKDIPKLNERCEHLMRRYRTKYRHELKTPHWTNGELNELGRFMKKFVKHHVHRRIDILTRMKYLERNSVMFENLYELKEWQYESPEDYFD